MNLEDRRPVVTHPAVTPAGVSLTLLGHYEPACTADGTPALVEFFQVLRDGENLLARDRWADLDALFDTEDAQVEWFCTQESAAIRAAA